MERLLVALGVEGLWAGEDWVFSGGSDVALRDLLRREVFLDFFLRDDFLDLCLATEEEEEEDSCSPSSSSSCVVESVPWKVPGGSGPLRA